MALDGKAAIVTGGAKGIGYAVARRFLEEGAKVVVADRDERAANRAIEELSSLGDVRAVACDVSQRLDVHNMIATTVNEFGDIDILINNAGIIETANFLDLDEADFDRVLATNLKGAFLCGQAVARHLAARVDAGGPAGSIVNMSSVNAVFALPDQAGYSVSKGGLNQLTKVMAMSLADRGIRVNGIGPGSVMTDTLKSMAGDDEKRRMILSRTPMGRIGEPSEIASIAAFLVSDDASYMTGQTLYADGGRLGLNFTVPVAED